MQLKGKRAVVTGGARGLGRAISIALHEAGATVLVNYYTSQEAAEALVQELGRGRAVYANVATAEGVNALFAAVDEEGGLDILVNNAGITRDGLLPRMRDEDWLEVMETNTTACFRTCRAASIRMMQQRSGSIINITSISGMRGNAGQTNSSASKAAVIGLTRSLARELGRRKIRVNAVAPGFFDTDMTRSLPSMLVEEVTKQSPLRRLGEPAELANMVRFLAGEESSYITGQVFVVDGGLTA